MSGRGCGLLLWHFLDFSLTFFLLFLNILQYNYRAQTRYVIVMIRYVQHLRYVLTKRNSLGPTVDFHVGCVKPVSSLFIVKGMYFESKVCTIFLVLVFACLLLLFVFVFFFCVFFFVCLLLLLFFFFFVFFIFDCYFYFLFYFIFFFSQGKLPLSCGLCTANSKFLVYWLHIPPK